MSMCLLQRWDRTKNMQVQLLKFPPKRLLTSLYEDRIMDNNARGGAQPRYSLIENCSPSLMALVKNFKELFFFSSTMKLLDLVLDDLLNLYCFLIFLLELLGNWHCYVILFSFRGKVLTVPKLESPSNMLSCAFLILLAIFSTSTCVLFL